MVNWNRKMCSTCNRKVRHNQKNECINCVTNKSKKPVLESDKVSV